MTQPKDGPRKTPDRSRSPSGPALTGDCRLATECGDPWPPAGRMLVFDRNEWECFIDGARNGEFDDAAEF